MTTKNQVYKDVANSPAGRWAAETAKSAAEGASDVAAMASKRTAARKIWPLRPLTMRTR